MIESITASISATQTAINLAKNVNSLVSDAETKLKIADLISALSDARVQLANAQEEKLELQQRIKELENQIASVEEVVFRDGLYYAKNPVKGKPKGPFCPNCYSNSKKVIPLTTLKGRWQTFGKYECPTCAKHFN